MKDDVCCDMRGFLSFQILWLLSKRDMCGEELAREIESRRGEKPKAGTIYPALRELKAKEFIRGKEDGKMVVYSLTHSGEKAVAVAKARFIRSFGDIILGS
jgi:DNA-binding PadR family transcriptional regulator